MEYKTKEAVLPVFTAK